MLLEGVNDRSVVLRVRHGEVTVLLTGDVEEDGRGGAARSGSGPVTVLKAPHHGSRTSSTRGLARAARPRYVVFCVGRRNRFGFPHPEVVERYRRAGHASVCRTDLDGAVTLESDGQDVRLVALPAARGRRPVAPVAAGGRASPALRR